MKSLQLPPFKEKNVLITGGAGFLGSNLARRLLQQGAILTLFLKKGEDCKNIKDIQKKLTIIEGDLLKEEDVTKAIQRQ